MSSTSEEVLELYRETARQMREADQQFLPPYCCPEEWGVLILRDCGVIVGGGVLKFPTEDPANR